MGKTLETLNIDRLIQERNARPQPEQVDQEQLMRDLLATPLFMNEAPSAEQIEQDPTLSALNALAFDGSPEDVANNFKAHGNESFAEGTVTGYRNAVAHYTKGIEVSCTDDMVNTVLFANRAAAQLELGNYRMCVNDCESSLRCDPHNVKAAYRGAKASLLLDHVDDALGWIQRGRLAAGSNTDGRILKLDELEAQIKTRQAFLAKKATDASQRQHEAKSERASLSQALSQRKLRLRGDLVDGPHQVRLDATTGKLLWPVLLLYPEFKQSDLISDICESDSFAQHLETVLANPLPWDERGVYALDAIELYFETNAQRPQLVRFSKNLRLSQVLQHPSFEIVNGIPNVMVLSRDSPFHDTWLQRYK